MATVHETYAAALQHDKADLPPGTRRVGVVRRPMGWFHGTVDENISALGPPDELLDAVKDRQAAFEEEEGLDERTAIRNAWEAVEFDDRYEQYLETADGAAAAMDRLLTTVRDGTDIALVCYESPEKPCHRHLLRERLQGRLDAD